MSKPVEITLLSKPGCHLCDDARAAIHRVMRELRVEEQAVDCTLDEVNILDDVGLARLHAEDIPVVLINGRRHAFWRVDETRLAKAVLKAAKPRPFHR